MATGTVESAVAVRVEESRDTEKSIDREKVSFQSHITFSLGHRTPTTSCG